MPDKIFKESFCEIKKIKVCTTTAELDFNKYTEPGTYEIYEDMGDGRSRVYFLTVDTSVTGACVKQTRIHCGKVDARNTTTSGTWTAWKEVSGSGGSSQPSEGGSGAILISVHDEKYNTIIPGDGQVYVVKFHDMPYGEDPSLISPEVFYRLRIGDGVTPLCDIPNVSNIVAGTGNGSAILVDPTYDNGDDGLEAPNNIADAQYAVAFGKYLKNYGKASAMFGYNNENHAARAFVAGQGNKVTEDAIGAFVAGFKNTVGAEKSAVFGQLNDIKGRYIFCDGLANKTGEGSHRVRLFGRGLLSNSSAEDGQAIFGRFNEEDNDALIIYGAGTSDTNRKNAFKLMRDGTVELLGTVRFDGKSFEIDRALSAVELTETISEATDNTAVPQRMYVDALGNLGFEDVDGGVTLAEHMKLTQYGHSDVTSEDMGEYTEYPAEGSDRPWAYLGNTAARSYSGGLFASTHDVYAQLAMTGKDTWTAFKLKSESLSDGIYSVLIDYSAVSTHAAELEVYVLPMTDEMQEEFAADNTETYGTTASAGDGTERLVRTGYKLFPQLTSIAGAEPTGKFCITSESGGAITVENEAFDMKVGAIKVTGENADKEWLVLFRNNGTAATATLRLVSIGFARFEPLTDAIKVGDTVLTEGELQAIKASAGTADISGFATKDELEETVNGITAESLGAATESKVTEMISEAVGGGATATFKYGTAAPTTLGEGEVFFVYEG